MILNVLFLLPCPASHLSSDTTDLKLSSKLPGIFSSSLTGFLLHLPHRSPNPSSLHLLQDFRGFNFFATVLAALCFSSVLHLLLTLLFLLFLFLLMCRVFPGVAAGRRCLAAPVPGAAAVAAAAAAASGAWGWEGASAAGAPSKRTQWSCRRKSLLPRLLLPAPPLWSPTGRPTPPTSRGTRRSILIKAVGRTCSSNILTLLI